MTEVPSGSPGQPDRNLQREKVTENRPARIAGLASVDPELVISDEQRLVPKDYKPDIAAAVVRAARDGHPGYPAFDPDPGLNKRLRWTQEQYDAWVEAGRPADALTGDPDASYFLNDHPQRHNSEAIAQGIIIDYDSTREYPPGTFGDATVDSRGGPIHPFAKEMLLAGVAVTGIGCNYSQKLNPAGDALAMQIIDGKLRIGVVSRKDSTGSKKRVALPGGKQDQGEPIEETGPREFAEEFVGNDQEFVNAIPRIAEPAYHSVTADPRDVINSAGRTTYVTVLLPTDEQVADPRLQNPTHQEEETDRAYWMVANEENIQNLWAMHPELVKLGIKLLQEKTGLIVDKEGRVGREPRKMDNKSETLQDNGIFTARLHEIKEMYQRAFAGSPWHETLSDEEVTARLDANMSKPGFTSFTTERDGRIAGALWYDTPSLDELEAERRRPLRDFADSLQEQTGIETLVWEREVMVHPDFQGQGIASDLRRDCLTHLAEKYSSGAIVLTRMREDNAGIVAIAEKLGFKKTGISHPSQKEGISQEFWYRIVPARK